MHDLIKKVARENKLLIGNVFPKPKNNQTLYELRSKSNKWSIYILQQGPALYISPWNTTQSYPIALFEAGRDDISAKMPTILANCEAYDENTPVDIAYVESVLKSPALVGNSFAQSLAKQLADRGNLSPKQISCVVGASNSRTLQASAQGQDPNLLDRYYSIAKKLAVVAPVMPRTFTLKPVKGDDVTLIPTSQHVPYQYPFEYFNPVQSLVFPHAATNCNLVIGANTSAGKTICAEMVMDYALKNGEKVIYMSPLKSLTQEKYTDWKKRFPEHNIEIMTGDYSISEARAKELENMDIICMTSEMLDSRTRKIQSEKNNWIYKVGLLVVDECFPGNTKIRIGQNYEVPIEDVFNNPNFTHVLAYNEKTKVLEKKRILRKIRKPLLEHLVEVSYQYPDGTVKKIKCTPNHKIWTSKGYVRADGLQPGDTVKDIPVTSNEYCEICDKNWTDASGGFSHHYYLQHICSSSLQCTVCKQTFKRKEDLKNHKKIHENRNTHTCGVCLQTWYDESKLSNHKCNTALVCPVCQKFRGHTFIELHQHVMQKHAAYLCYVCDICGQLCKNKGVLSAHKIKMHWSKDDRKSLVEKRKAATDWTSFGRSISKSPKHAQAMKRLGLQRRGKNNPVFLHDNQGLKKMTAASRERWANLSDYDKEVQIKRFMNAPLHRNGGAPTSLEQKIIEADFPGVIFTGDGSKFVTFKNGRKKNPDFIVEGQRKVIEAGDFEHWHTTKETDEVVVCYEEIGYKCLYLSDIEINEQWEHTSERIQTFLSNHDCVVLGVRRVRKTSKRYKQPYVYNLEVEDHHNYLANGLLVSNCHILDSPDRGHPAEVGIMRFTANNDKARVLMLSATMPNVEEFGTWLKNLNKKRTEVIFCDWRPVTLQMHYIEYANGGDYFTKRERKIELSLDPVLNKPDEKFLIFVHDKNTGREVIKKLNDRNIKAVFHNADLDINSRTSIEDRFKHGDLRVIVATSTLAWGVNLPARNVVIVGVHRGINDVDELDIIQMIGRAGRFKIDTEGHVYLIVPQDTTIEWQNKIKHPKPVTSSLKQVEVLAFHILGELYTQTVTNEEEICFWFDRSLAAVQNTVIDDEYISCVMKDLNEMDMLRKRRGRNEITLSGLGTVSALMYYSPYNIYDWYVNMRQLFDDNMKIEEKLLAWAVADITSNRMSYIPKFLEEDVTAWKDYLRSKGIQPTQQSFTAIASVIGAECALKGIQPHAITLKSAHRGIVYDAPRMMSAISMIDNMYANWDYNWEDLGLKIQYGVDDILIDFVRIPGVGKKRAISLYEMGYNTINDLADAEWTELASVLTKTLAQTVVRNAKKIVAKRNKHR